MAADGTSLVQCCLPLWGRLVERTARNQDSDFLRPGGGLLLWQHLYLGFSACPGWQKNPNSCLQVAGLGVRVRRCYVQVELHRMQVNPWQLQAKARGPGDGRQSGCAWASFLGDL